MKLFALLVARAAFAFIQLRKHWVVVTVLLMLQAGLIAIAALALGAFGEQHPRFSDADASATGSFITANGTTATSWQLAGPSGPGMQDDGGALTLFPAAITTDTPTSTTTILAQVAYTVPLAGTFNITMGSPDVTSTVSGVVTPGQTVVFAPQQVAYTILSATGTAIVLTSNYTGGSDTTSSAVLISSTSANQPNGNILIDLGAVTNLSNVNHVLLKQNGNVYGAIGADGIEGAIWLRNNDGPLTPISTNYVLASDGNITNLNAPASAIRFNVAGSLSMQMGTILGFYGFGTVQYSDPDLTPIFNEVQVQGTDAGSVQSGHTWSITGQQGGPAYGLSNIAGMGANINISSGLGGASLADAGFNGDAGEVNLQVGGTSTTAGTTVFGVDYAGNYVEKSSGISTASATVTLTNAQMESPYLILNGTTATPSCTIKIGASPIANTARYWFIDWSGVTLSTNSIIFTAGSGATTATLTAATAIGKVLVLFEPTANTVYLLGI
jgi:hypothetical protein